jgi:hypothetical protein
MASKNTIRDTEVAYVGAWAACSQADSGGPSGVKESCLVNMTNGDSLFSE